MYDLPEVRGHVDRLWAALRDRMRERGLAGVPDALTHLDDGWDAHWTSSSIYVSQVCGVEVVTRFADRYRVLATPRFSAPGCTAYHYRSLVVVREDAGYRELEDLRGARIAINSSCSHSGSTSLLPLVAPLSRGGRFFSGRAVTGSHERSLAALRGGQAEVAAVDCVTYHLLARYRPAATEGLRVLATTPPAPAPPYVAPASFDARVRDQMRAALVEVFAGADLEDVRRALFLDGVDQTDDSAYVPILEFLESGQRYGYELSCPGGGSRR